MTLTLGILKVSLNIVNNTPLFQGNKFNSRNQTNLACKYELRYLLLENHLRLTHRECGQMIIVWITFLVVIDQTIMIYDH